MADDKLKLEDETTEMASPEDIQEVLDEETPLPKREEALTETLAKWEEEGEEEVTPIPKSSLNVASIRDRFAAGFFDLLVLGYLYCGTLLIYNYVVWRQFLRPIPAFGAHTIVFHGIFTVLAFLYFFISEGVFFTSLGKFFAGLSVRNSQGDPASLFSIFLRNLLRPLDILLSVLPTWILLEKLPKRQRLGDVIASTVVMKHFARAPTRIATHGAFASATVRLLAGFIDLVFSTAWMAGVFLFIDYQKPLFSFLILLLVPLTYLIWHLMWEGIFQTTFGLWIFGLKIVGEDGSPIGFTQAMLRAIFKLFDTNPLGWASLFLSNKNQRPSDLMSGTLTVYTKRSLHVLIGLGISLAAIVGVWFTGQANPRNYLTPFFRIDFLSRIFTIQTGGGVISPAAQGLFIKRFSYLMMDRTTQRPSAEFKPGETILFSFDVTGFAVRNNEAWIQEDLTVRYPNNEIGFKQENIVDFHQLLKNPEIPLEIINTLALPPNAQAGHYTLVLVLHDRFSDRHLTEQRTFRVAP